LKVSPVLSYRGIVR